MLADLWFAVLHHILIFLLAGVLAAEAALIRPGLRGGSLAFLGRVDAAYGALAAAVLAAGICRLAFGYKGWEAYLVNWAFWGKMAAFAAVGLLSIPPTMRILRWRRTASANGDYVVPDGEISGAQRFLWAQAAVFALIPVFAAVMARGYGYF
jgi:putative membrane protein